MSETEYGEVFKTNTLSAEAGLSIENSTFTPGLAFLTSNFVILTGASLFTLLYSVFFPGIDIHKFEVYCGVSAVVSVIVLALLEFR